jgi:histidyl-tRNA synthetase
MSSNPKNTASAGPAVAAKAAKGKGLTDARRPRGFEDRGPDEIAATREMIETIRKVYELYGFEAVETPLIETTDALGKFLPDQDRPNAGVFSFQDDDERWLSLRYDLTAPLARYVAENFDRLPKPYRSYRVGPVFRNEKPGPGRFRQFMQFDADTVGAAGVAADAENCMMVADAMEALGIPRGSYVVKVNNRKVLDGVMDAIGLGGPEQAATRLTVLRAIDKMDKFPVAEVRKLLGPGRLDESGDFTKGAGLDDVQTTRLLALFELRLDPAEGGNLAVSGLEKIMPFEAFVGSATDEGLRELSTLQSFVRTSGYGPERIRIDPSVVRGLEYYTGLVYEVELTFPVEGDDGQPVRFGSVGGGGRYDGLVGRFRAEDVPATGISIGVSRLQAALTHLGRLGAKTSEGPVVVTVMDRDRIAEYQRLVTELRHAGIRAELYLGDSGFKAQMKYADRRHARFAVIEGSSERERGVVQVKDLVIGAELAAGGKDRADYLDKQAQAQVEVPRAELVAYLQARLPRD